MLDIAWFALLEMFHSSSVAAVGTVMVCWLWKFWGIGCYEGSSHAYYSIYLVMGFGKGEANCECVHRTKDLAYLLRMCIVVYHRKGVWLGLRGVCKWDLA